VSGTLGFHPLKETPLGGLGYFTGRKVKGSVLKPMAMVGQTPSWDLSFPFVVDLGLGAEVMKRGRALIQGKETIK
jgi:hypothetical protein